MKNITNLSSTELVKRVVKVTTENAKYLSITISQDLSWKTHVENISSKANNTLKFLKRNIQTQNNKNPKETAYNTYVRP